MLSAANRSRLFAAVLAATRQITGRLRTFFSPARVPARCEPMEGRIMLSATDPFGTGSHYFDQAPFSTSTLGGEVAQADPNALGTTDAAVSPSGVRYYDGVPVISDTDFSSNGYGQTWGVTRTYSSDMTGTGSLGNHWFLNQLPQLVQEGTADANQPAGATGTIILVGSAYDQRWFDDVSSTWTERYGGQDTLASVTYSGKNALELTTSSGQSIYFYDFSSGNGAQKGQFIASTDPYGNLTSVTSTDGSGDITDVQRANGSDVEDWHYTFNTPGGVITNIKLEQSTNSGSTFTTVRQDALDYYTTGDSGGNSGDLESVTTEDGSGNPISTYGYVYWLGTETVSEGGTNVTQPADAIKYVYDPQSYARLMASLSSGYTLANATNAMLSGSAQSYFSYNSSGQVYQATVAGQGGDSTYGLGTFTYAYQTNGNAGYTPGFSEWATFANETLPDGNSDRLYSNYGGEPLFSVTTSGSSHWGTFREYNSNGLQTLVAEPSAITLPAGGPAVAALKNNNDILNSQSGNYQYLSDDSGLVYTTAYYSGTPTATSTTAGAVAGYFESSSLQQGELGTAIPQETRQYFAVSGSSIKIYPVATDEVYTGAGGSGGETTSYSYTWFSGTDQPQTMTVTPPSITTGDAPSSDAKVYTLDQYNWVTAYEDGDGYYTDTTWDIPTGGITQTVTDSGSTGHLNLTTSYSVDFLGRPTKITSPSPNSNVTYIIYNDPAHQTSTYEGWHQIGMSGTYTTTGPVQVSRTYYPAANAPAGCQTLYFETLTFNPPVESTSAPSGSETIDQTNIQSLSRRLTDPAGQINEADTFFSLSGITYSQATPNLGSSSNNSAVGNYYATLYGFDNRGNESHVQDPTGTITDTTWNVLGQPVSTSAGTNDTTSNNMVTVNTDYYDQRRAAPSAPTLSQSGSSVTGGSTLYVKVTYLGPTGESLASSESSQLVYSGNSLVVASPASVAGATSYNIYIAGFSSNETQQNSSPQALGTNYTIAPSALISGSLLPVDQVGDGNLTESLQPVDTTSSDNRETQTLFDFRDRQVAEKVGVQSSEGSINRPIYLWTLDNLGEVSGFYTYLGDGVSLFDFGNGQPSSDASKLRAQVLNCYDSQQRLYQSQQYEVDPTSGSVSSTNILTTGYYWDNRDLLVAESDPGGQWLKHAFDGAGRDIKDSTTDGGALNGTSPSYTVASTTSSDVVVEQTLKTLDADGNTIETLDRQRFDNDPSTSTGDLAGPSGGNLASRDYYTDYYFDQADREVDSADVGTNGGIAWTRPGSPNSSSSTYLLTGASYAGDTVEIVTETGSPTSGTFSLALGSDTATGIALNASASAIQSDLISSGIGAGNVSVSGPAGGPYVIVFTGTLAGQPQPLMTATTSGFLPSGSSVSVSITSVGGDNGSVAVMTDPAGNGGSTSVNLAGQPVETVTGGTTPQTILNTWDGDGDILTTTNLNSGSVDQTTAYLYAAGGTAGTNIFANNLLTKVEYPDKTTGLPSTSSANDESYAYNFAGDATSYTDRNGTTHAYTYNVLGQKIADEVTLATGNPQNIDNTVMSLGYSFNVFGQPAQQTSYSGSNLTGVVDQVTDAYNGFDQLDSQNQNFPGGYAVSGSVQYVYSETANGTENNSRLVATVYPDGRVVDTTYSALQQPVASITHSGTTATVTTSLAISGLTTGQKIVIQGATPAAYDGTFTVGTVSGATFTYTLGSTPGSNASGNYMTAAPQSLDQTISRPDALQDGISASGSTTPGTVLEGYTYLGLNTIVQESHPETGIDLTYISQSGDTSAPPSYAATGGDRYKGLDQFGRVDDQFYVNPSSVTSPTDRFQYSYDLNSNVLYKDVVEMGGTAATFSQLYHASGGLDSAAFDGQNRMTNFEQGTLSHTNASNGSGVLDTVATSTATQALTLDSLGNWTASAVTGGGSSETRTVNAQNQIANNSGSTTPTYDNNGNVTKDDASNTYTYTAWNQMAGASAGGQQYAFTYLPNGPQASIALACCGNTSTYSFYSTSWQDLEDVPPSGSESTYVWGLENVNELVERDDGSGTRLYAQHDANMDVTALVNTSGSVVERFSYSPFGVATVLTSAWSSTTDSDNWIFMWQGGRYNADTGLYTFGYRDYSPTLATWMEEDPTGYAAGPNVYQAMLGAPIELTDPYGLQAGSATSASVASSGGVEGSGSPATYGEPGAPGSPVLGPPAPSVSVTEPPGQPTSQPAQPPYIYGPLGPPAPNPRPAPPTPPIAQNHGPKAPYPPNTTVTPGGSGPTGIYFPDGSTIYVWNDPNGIDTPTILRLGPDGSTLPPLPSDKPAVQPEVLNWPPYQSPPTKPPGNPIIIKIPLPLGSGDWQFVYNPLNPTEAQVSGSLGPDTTVNITVGNHPPTGGTNGGAHHK